MAFLLLGRTHLNIPSWKSPLGYSTAHTGRQPGTTRGSCASDSRRPIMEEFKVPEDVGDVSALQVAVAGHFCATEDLPSLRDETSERLNDLLDGVGTRLENDGADSLSEQSNFDDMFSIVR